MLNVQIESADMTYEKGEGYLGRVQFKVEGHPQPYEMTLHSKSAKDWAYSLMFASESGEEAHIEAVEEAIEEDDELFDQLVNAAMERLQR